MTHNRYIPIIESLHVLCRNPRICPTFWNWPCFPLPPPSLYCPRKLTWNLKINGKITPLFQCGHLQHLPSIFHPYLHLFGGFFNSRFQAVTGGRRISSLQAFQSLKYEEPQRSPAKRGVHGEPTQQKGFGFKQSKKTRPKWFDMNFCCVNLFSRQMILLLLELTVF